MFCSFSNLFFDLLGPNGQEYQEGRDASKSGMSIHLYTSGRSFLLHNALVH